jgi:hypothetical protein
MWKAIKSKLKSSQGTIIAGVIFLIAFMAVVFAIGLATGKINPTRDEFPLTKEITTYKASLDGRKIWRVTLESK